MIYSCEKNFKYKGKIISVNIFCGNSNDHKILLVLAFLKSCMHFLCDVSIAGDIKNFVQILIYCLKPKLSKHKKSLTRKAYHILELPGLGLFCDY